METVRIQNGETEKIVASFYDSADAAITGETVPMSIWRDSDGYYYTGSAWQSGHTTFNMSEKGQGDYYYNFDTSGLSDDAYHIKAICSNSSCVNPVQVGELKVGYYVDDIVSIKSKTDDLPEARHG